MNTRKVQSYLIKLFLFCIIVSSSLLVYESFPRQSYFVTVESVVYEKTSVRAFSIGKTKLVFNQFKGSYFLHGNYENEISIGDEIEFSPCQFFSALCFLKSNKITYRPASIVYVVFFLVGLVSLIYSTKSVSFVFLTAVIYVFLLFKNISALSFLILKMS